MAYPRTIIRTKLRNAKLYSQDFLEKMLDRESKGEDIRSLKIEFIIMIRLIQALDRYYNANYDSTGEPLEEPLQTCIDAEYYEKLIRKLNEITKGASYPSDGWLLEYGVWDDDGYWRDSASWID